MTTNTHTSLCLHCGKPAGAQLVCPGCDVVASPAPASDADHFAVFALPRRLTIDLADLEQRYYALSRRLHPDRFHDRPPAEQAASLRMTALVNRAYRTLKDPVQRALYWLELHGESLGRDNERVPPALAARVFEVQEQLEELRAAGSQGSADALRGAVESVRDQLKNDLRGCEARLGANFTRTDAADGNGGTAPALAETKTILSELHYVRTLLRDVEKELGPAWNAS
jgi:molecular chaperone HscB